MSEFPITLTCPDCGAEWPSRSVKATQETYPERLTFKHITFQMPCSCFPSLSKMVRTKQFTRKEADIILAQAQRVANDVKKKAGRS